MVIRNIQEDLDCTLIHLDNPYKHTEHYYLSEIAYNEEPLVIQTPVISFKNSNNTHIELLLDHSMLRAINKIDNNIIKQISDNSEDWFGSELSIEETRDIYKSSISFPLDEYDVASLRLNYSDKLKIYDKYNPQLELKHLEQNTPVIGLIKLNCVVFYRHTCVPQWEIISMKLKNKASNKLKSCIIADEENDTDENNDEKVKVIVFNENQKLF